ncbi:hypothetical protein DL770_009794 [Monosporascus sp. CRB-9-2]|nr:hypothetical protein DL770_009794 [Monosporascus sp. CRB-9-2]
MEQLANNGNGTATSVALVVAVETPPPPPAKQQQLRQRSLVPRGWEDQVRSVGIAEHKEAALSLAQAFARDDLALYLVDGEVGSSDEEKWRLHVDIFRYLVAAHCYSGVVTTIGPDYEGVALWVLPGQDTDDWTTTLRSGMWRLPWQLSAEGRRRYYDELMPLLHDTKREVLGPARDGDCYYLVYLGTRPSGRGRGYARKLIEQMAARADAEGRAMYLESSSAKNNLYYKKFGFEAKKDIHLGQTTTATALPAVTLTIMVREPRHGGSGSGRLHAGSGSSSAVIPIKLSPGSLGKVVVREGN